MEKNDGGYKWWEDKDLWNEYDGEDLEDKELTSEEKNEIEELFESRLPDQD